jgi:hypothetical protein
MKPTQEQEECIEKFGTGKKLRIGAYAGTGKTASLVMISKSTRKTGTYLAFNKSIADESSRKFPGNISCSTQHSLAFRSLKDTYSFDKLTGKLAGGFVASRMKLPSFEVEPTLEIFPRGVGYLALKTISRWCSSGRPEMRLYDVPLIGRLADISDARKDALRKFILGHAEPLWENMKDRKSDMPLGHDGYLKLWAMSRPRLAGDFILLDEAQDSSGVIMELMRHQSAQLICVGDASQAIYEWRGARNAMVELPTDNESRLSMSFRFGHEIANHATGILSKLGETLPLRGNPEKSSIGVIDKPDTILCRTNGRLIEELLNALEKGRKPCVIGGVRELLDMIGAAEKLMDGKSVDYPLDFFGFKNWQEVQRHAETDEGREIRRVVQCIDKYGCGPLRAALESLPKDESQADIIFSTGHKSKGREWPRVRVCSDFLMGVKTADEIVKAKEKAVKEGREYVQPDYSAELRLFYVACTRAMEHLEVPETLTEKLQSIEVERAS